MSVNDNMSISNLSKRNINPYRPDDPLHQVWARENNAIPATRKEALTPGKVRARELASRRTQDSRQINKNIGDIRQYRAGDLRSGREFFDKNFLDDAAISRIGGSKLFQAGKLDARVSPEMAEILAKKKAGLEGLSAEENQALREDTFKNLNAQNQLANRALRAQLGSSGLRGGVALAAQAELAKEQAAKNVDLERKLLVDNINIKNQAMKDYEDTYNRQRADILDRDLRNTARLDQILQAGVGSQFGFANLGAAERGEATSRVMGERMQEIAGNIKAPSKSHFCGYLRSRGYISQEQYKQMSAISRWAIFRYGDFSYWYFTNAEELIRDLEKRGVDWKDVANVLIGETIDLLKTSDLENAGLHYANLVIHLSDTTDGKHKKFDMYLDRGVIRNFFGWSRLLLLKEFWRASYRIIRASFKKSLRGGLRGHFAG